MSTEESEELDVMSVVRARVKELRGRNGWSGAELGEHLSAVGVAWNRSIVANFEAGRRPSVSAVELLALAQVLNVAPIHLLVPPDAEGDRLYEVTPALAAPVADVRAWIRGYYPLKADNLSQFHREAPRAEWGAVRMKSSNDPQEQLDAVRASLENLKDYERQLAAQVGEQDG
ncbi:helix-turn-helix domain-containing protein [Streptomyces parvus]|nr:helix-turn-helix domain-containing protein [Streptomyces parvus]